MKENVLITSTLHHSWESNDVVKTGIWCNYDAVSYTHLNLYTKWDRNNYGPIWIPAKGATIKLTEDNLPIYERCIVAYEGNKLEVKEDGIYINGEKTDSYTLNMD